MLVFQIVTCCPLSLPSRRSRCPQINKQVLFQSKVLDFVIHCHAKEQSHFNPLILVVIVSILFNNKLPWIGLHIFTVPNKTSCQMLYLIINKLYINQVQWIKIFTVGLFAGYIGTSEMLLTLLNLARQPTVSYQQSIRVFDQNHFKEKQQI